MTRLFVNKQRQPFTFTKYVKMQLSEFNGITNLV